MSINIKSLGAYIIYSASSFEAEYTTLSGAKRCVAKLTRLNLRPSVARHAVTVDGFHINVDCDPITLDVLPFPEPAIATTVHAVEPAVSQPSFCETRREEFPDGSSMMLSFAIRVF